MNKNILLHFFLLPIFCFLFSCSNLSDDYKTSPNGLKYKIIVDNKQPKAQYGQYITYHVFWRNLKDSLLLNTEKENRPLMSLVARPVYDGDPWEILAMLGAGDSASLKVPAKIIFKKYLPPNMSPDEMMKMDIKVLSVMSQQQYDSVQLSTVRESNKSEDERLQKYIQDNKLAATKTSSGLYVVIEKQGTGKKAEEGNTVKVLYTGKLLNGDKFDSSADHGGDPYEFKIGSDPVVQGWVEGLQYFSKGGKGKLIIPSKLGWGERGSPPKIGPNEPVVFDIELIDIK